MEKNWLIRTVEHRILGPASKDKIIELMQKGSLRSEDELCTGNGFWFFVREKELLDRYLFSEEIQPFNPISEAQSVLAKEKKAVQIAAKPLVKKDGLLKIQSIEKTLEAMAKNTDGTFMIKFPEEEDLEYPDIQVLSTPTINRESQTEGTVLLNMNQRGSLHQLEAKKDLSKLKINKKDKIPVKDDSGIFFPDNTDLEYPEIDLHMEAIEKEKLIKPEEIESEDELSEDSTLVAKELRVDTLKDSTVQKLKGPDTQKVEEYKTKRGEKVKTQERRATVNARSNVLFYLILLGVAIISLGFYFYYKNINLDLSFVKKIEFFNSAYAQENVESLRKKKSLIHFHPLNLI